MVAYKIEIKKSKLANIRWLQSYFEEINMIVSYSVYILLLDKINSNYYKAKYLSDLFFYGLQWTMVDHFGNDKISQHIKIFWDKSYSAVYSRISRVGHSMDRMN